MAPPPAHASRELAGGGPSHRSVKLPIASSSSFGSADLGHIVADSEDDAAMKLRVEGGGGEAK